MSTQLRYSIHDFDHLPEDNSRRFEIIDGELYVSTAPHIRHQTASFKIATCLGRWSDVTRSGFVEIFPGVIFADDNAVVPDIVWVSRERYARILGEDGKFHAAPDLVVELISPGSTNAARDLEIKLKLYSRQGVREYWIVDWLDTTIRVYRRGISALELVATFMAEDNLESPLLPGFSERVSELCAPNG